MGTVTRIVASKDPNRLKYDALSRQAEMLGALRKDVWHRFGSIQGPGIDFRALRNDWVKNRRVHPRPLKAWKETLRDVLDDIAMDDGAVKLRVEQEIAKRESDKRERIELYKKLDGTEWKTDLDLSRKMQQFKKHGQTNVDHQTILEGFVYSHFTGKDGHSWHKVPSYTRGARVSIPLSSNVVLHGCLRLILEDSIISVHPTIEQKEFSPSGDRIPGVDKGDQVIVVDKDYLEAFADSEGGFHRTNLGEVLSKGTEKRNSRRKSRNKLYQIAKKKPHKDKNLYDYKLGRKKLVAQSEHQKALIRDKAFQAAHSIVDKAKEVRCEDLTKTFSSKDKWKTYNRTMSAWARGSLAEALESVAKTRGSCLQVVKASYTSQMDSKTRRLEGGRVGDNFYHVDGQVSHADTNAAVHIKDRADDTEISLFTPHREVKKILLDRLTANGGVRPALRDDRPSRTPVARRKRTSTESESHENTKHSFV